MQIIGALHVSILPGAPQILGLTLKTGTIYVPFHVAGIAVPAAIELVALLL